MREKFRRLLCRIFGHQWWLLATPDRFMCDHCGEQRWRSELPYQDRKWFCERCGGKFGRIFERRSRRLCHNCYEKEYPR